MQAKEATEATEAHEAEREEKTDNEDGDAGDVEPERKKKCAVCGSDAPQKCGGCQNTYYCSRLHQKKDWKRHAELCRSFKMTKDRNVGRHYVASRTIKPGEIVLKDAKPLVAGPMTGCPAVCLSCYAVLQPATAHTCSNCGWPLCANCKGHGSECEFTHSRRDSNVSIKSFGLPHPSYNCITVIRALALKEKDPKSYGKLLALEDHRDQIKEQGDSKFGNPLLIVGLMRRLFRMDDITDEEIMKIIGILQVNGHEVPITEPAHLAVYDLASYLEHDCRANCGKSFTEEGGLVVHAAVTIPKGGHISISYTDSLWGASNRQHHLSRTKFFTCRCVRCSDPTELGTMYNAIKCSKIECNGYMLPQSFLTEEIGDYACGKCSSSLASSRVDDILEGIGQELARMEKNSVKACREFILKHGSVLHENHYYNTDVNVARAQLIGEEKGVEAATDAELREKLELCGKLDRLLRVIAPAEVRVRGILLFEMHAVLAEQARRTVADDALDLLKSSRKYLVEARALLQYEPKVLAEGKIAATAEKNLQRLDATLKTICLTMGTT